MTGIMKSLSCTGVVRLYMKNFSLSLITKIRWQICLFLYSKLLLVFVIKVNANNTYKGTAKVAKKKEKWKI